LSNLDTRWLNEYTVIGFERFTVGYKIVKGKKLPKV
jgi:hypothetical protein